MDEEKEKRKGEFYKTFFLLLMLFGTAPKEEREKFLQKMKEIEQEPGGNGVD